MNDAAAPPLGQARDRPFGRDAGAAAHPMISNPSDRLLLRAALEPQPDALQAFARWRGEVDLNDVAGTAFRLLPLVYHNIGPALPDDAIKARLRGIARHAWLRSRSRWFLCSAAVDGLSKRQIPFILIKGTALVVILGGVTELRVQADCDLLVSEENAAEAVNLMLELGLAAWRLAPGGFRLDDYRAVHGLDFARPTDKFGLLDLHWRPLIDVEGDGLTREFFARSKAAALNGREVRVPAMEDVFLQSVIHGSKFEEPLRYDWMADCHLMMRLAGDRIDWRRLWDTAERYGLAGILEDSLDVLGDTILPPIPSRVWRRPTGRVSALERREAKARTTHPVDRSQSDWLILALQRIRRADPELSREPLDACLPALRRKLRGAALPTAAKRPASLKLWFVSGWSLPEAQGRWTDGSIALLAVRLPAGPERRLVLRTVSTAPAGQKAPTARLFAGGRLVATLQAKDGKPTVYNTAIDVSEAGTDDGWAVLQFRISDPFIPARRNRRGDPRQLGVLLVSATWIGEPA